MMQEGEVLDIKEFHQDNTVDFHIKFKDNISSIDVEKKLKLTTNISFNNFVLFNDQHQIKKYQDELEIL